MTVFPLCGVGHRMTLCSYESGLTSHLPFGHGTCRRLAPRPRVGETMPNVRCFSTLAET